MSVDNTVKALRDAARKAHEIDELLNSLAGTGIFEQYGFDLDYLSWQLTEAADELVANPRGKRKDQRAARTDLEASLAAAVVRADRSATLGEKQFIDDFMRKGVGR